MNLKNKALSKKTNKYILSGDKCCREKNEIKRRTLRSNKDVEKVD